MIIQDWRILPRAKGPKDHQFSVCGRMGLIDDAWLYYNPVSLYVWWCGRLAARNSLVLFPSSHSSLVYSLLMGPLLPPRCVWWCQWVSPATRVESIYMQERNSTVKRKLSRVRGIDLSSLRVISFIISNMLENLINWKSGSKNGNVFIYII